MSVIAVIGLGYVGLPLVIEFGRTERVVGFDNSVLKVESCQRGVDPSRELPDEEMATAEHAEYTADPKLVAEADIIIVAVPTLRELMELAKVRGLSSRSTRSSRKVVSG
jgi:UDP-N-acetyl-D-glucosamine/UDP-N-acetyl-D-galactosamine dehydrogenase